MTFFCTVNIFPLLGELPQNITAHLTIYESMHKKLFELVDVTDMGHQPNSITFSM
jgi:hypothetical protein